MDQTRRIPADVTRDDVPTRTFGELLREFRLARGWTQEELAERANLSTRAIINWERGATRRPQREPMRLLIAALDLSPDDRARLATALQAPPAQPVAPPSARAASSPPPMHLPTPLTPLLGREAELASLTALLTRHDPRLVTLVGTGGVGKTRLALAAAAAVRDAYAAGVYFVSLAPVREPEVLWLATVQTLGITPTATQTQYDALLGWLRGRQALLVLDNVEHLLAQAATVATLLAACPGVTALVTSRIPLRVRGEQEYPLAPLATPDRSAAVSAIATSPATRVFTHYARAVRPEFELTAENAAAIAAICAHLEGIPLALELAAARTRWFTAAQLLERLTPRLPILVNGPRDVAPRQQTMRAAIAWSDELLSAEERETFVRSAVFAGGATADAVEAVCGAGATTHADALVMQNLLTATTGADGAPRYGMLETVREYAWERARQVGVAEEARRSHAAYFLALAEEARSRLRGRERREWRQRVTTELDNLRAALRWAADAGDTATSLRLTHALQPYWRAQGYLREGAEWARAALAMRESPEPDMAALRARALVSAGNLHYQLAGYEQAVTLVRDGLALARLEEDEQTIADALWLLGLLTLERGELAHARGHLEESLARFRRLDRSSAIARVLHSLANEAFMRGEYPRAIQCAEESYVLSAGLGEGEHAAIELSMLARIHNANGEPARAVGYAEESVALLRRAGEVSSLGTALLIHGGTLRALHRSGESLALYDEGIAIAREVGAARSEFWGVMARAEALFALGDYSGAAASFARGFALAGRLTSKQPYAPGLEGVGILAHALCRHEEAVTLLGAATALQRTIGMPQRPEAEEALDAARRALGDAAFAAAWEHGATVPLASAVAAAGLFLASVSAEPHQSVTGAPECT